MDISTDYTFQLILRTTAGTFPSNVLHVKTHSMSDTSGISVCFGNVQDAVLLENAKLALREMGAKWSDKIQIDTSHFVCTTPAATPSGANVAGNTSGAPGVAYQRALQLSIPVVQPHWILACHAEKRCVSSAFVSCFPLPHKLNVEWFLSHRSIWALHPHLLRLRSSTVINPCLKCPCPLHLLALRQILERQLHHRIARQCLRHLEAPRRLRHLHSSTSQLRLLRTDNVISNRH